MGDTALAIVLWTLIAAIGAFGFVGWVAARATQGRISGASSGLLVGTVTLVVILGLLTFPLLQVVDLYSVGIELGILEPASVEPPISESRGGPVAPPGERGGSEAGDALRTAVARTQTAAWYTIIVLAALLGAATLGGIAAGRTSSRPGPDPGTAVVSLIGLMALVAVLTVWLWPSLRATATAVSNMDQSVGPDAGVNLSEVAQHPEAMWGRPVTASGLVDRVLVPRALLLGNDTPVVGHLALVLGQEPLAELVMDDECGEARCTRGMSSRSLGKTVRSPKSIPRDVHGTR